jgi:hypothetical protein
MSKISIIVFPVLYILGILAASIGNNHSLLDKIENAKQPSFFPRHGKTIAWIGNIFLLLWIGYWFYLAMQIPAQSLSTFLGERPHPDNSHIWMVFSTFLVGMTCFSGVAGASAGFMSIFQCNITKRKRIVLLVICLLPASLTVANLIIKPQLGLFSTDSWLIIKLGLLYSFIAWFFNGTTIIFGKHIMILGTMGLHKIIALMKKPLV